MLIRYQKVEIWKLVFKHMEVAYGTHGLICDLTIAGRIIIKEGNGDSVTYSHKLVRIEEPIMRVPTLAIHLDRGVNDGFKVNTQTHLAPVLATAVKAELNKPVAENCPDGKPIESPNTSKHHSLLLQLIATQAGCKPEDICDFELQACDTQPSIIAGAMKEFVFSGRLDSLCMSFCSLKALIDATDSEKSMEDESLCVRMVALFAMKKLDPAQHKELGPSSCLMLFPASQPSFPASQPYFPQIHYS